MEAAWSYTGDIPPNFCFGGVFALTLALNLCWNLTWLKANEIQNIFKWKQTIFLTRSDPSYVARRNKPFSTMATPNFATHDQTFHRTQYRCHQNRLLLILHVLLPTPDPSSPHRQIVPESKVRFSSSLHNGCIHFRSMNCHSIHFHSIHGHHRSSRVFASPPLLSFSPSPFLDYRSIRRIRVHTYCIRRNRRTHCSTWKKGREKCENKLTSPTYKASVQLSNLLYPL